MNNEKKIGGFSLFSLWFGAAVSLAEIMTGSLIAPLGIKNGLIVIVIGHLIGCLILAVVGMIGFNEKKPSLISSRFSLGKYGSYIVSVFNIIQLIGWTAIMLIQCTKAIQPVTQSLFGFQNYHLIIVGVGILVAIWAIFANKGINLLNNIAVALLGVLSLTMLGLIIQAGYQPKIITETISFGAALELSIIMPLSWVPLISDYTMRGKTTRGSFIGSFAGYFLGSSLMYAIGLVTAVYTGNSDPIGVLANLNMGFAALIIVIFATVTTTFMDVYSGVLSTINIAPKVSKVILIIIYSAVGTILALFFQMEQYMNFLYMIGSLFAPVFTVILADYFLLKKDWSSRFINTTGIITAAIGTGFYYLFVKLDWPIGSTVPAMIITLFIYLTIRTILNGFQKQSQISSTKSS